MFALPNVQLQEKGRQLYYAFIIISFNIFSKTTKLFSLQKFYKDFVSKSSWGKKINHIYKSGSLKLQKSKISEL